MRDPYFQNSRKNPVKNFLLNSYDMSKSVADKLPVIVFGDHTRSIKFIDFPFAAGADGIKVLAPTALVVPKLFFRFLQVVKLPDKGYARHFQHLRASYIAMPPLNEQKRIADKLDALLARVDTCRARLDRVPLILKRFRQSVLAAATSGKLTKEWRNLPGENMCSVRVTDPYSHTVVGPESWRKTTCGADTLGEYGFSKDSLCPTYSRTP